MKTRTKLLLDRLFGWPLMIWLQVPTRVLGFVLRRDHSVNAPGVRRIVVAKYVGLGSVVQTTPLLRALRKAYPAARVEFLTSEVNSDFCSRLEGIDRVLTINEHGPFSLGWSCFAAWWRLFFGGRVDLFIDLEVYSAFGALVALSSCARNRYGFYRTAAGLRRGLYTHLMYFNTRQPIRMIYGQLGRLAGATEFEFERLGPVIVKESEVTSLSAKLGELKGKLVVVNANASDLLIERRWPMERFVEALNLLSQDDVTFAFTGTRGEAGYVASLVNKLGLAAKARTLDLSGKLSLGEFLALIQRADCVFTNDTGPMHIALAFNKPMVCLFGPGSPQHYGVERDNVRILYKQVYCSPCLYETAEPPCHGHNTCMQRIEAAEAVAALREVLAGRSLPAGRSAPPVDFVDERGFPLGKIVQDSV